jgi:hypothetical protein
MLKLLDIFFILFHTALTLFNLFGWIIKKTRRINLYTLLATGASWFLLGIFYGIGYCPLTDWHFEVLRRLGHYNLPYSYIKYLYDRITGSDINAQLVDVLTGVLFSIAFVLSLVLNLRDLMRKKKQNKD